jgi:hypothetical protein
MWVYVGESNKEEREDKSIGRLSLLLFASINKNTPPKQRITLSNHIDSRDLK